jgi:hypothetical protein
MLLANFPFRMQYNLKCVVHVDIALSTLSLMILTTARCHGDRKLASGGTTGTKHNPGFINYTQVIISVKMQK